MSASRKHHFIPIFYLKQWSSNDGNVIEWSKQRSGVVPHRKHPSATAYQKDLYSFDGLRSNDRQWFEDQFLRNVDNLASDALRMILSDRLAELDWKQRSAWTRFVLALLFRHPDALDEIKKTAKITWQKQLVAAEASYEVDRDEQDPPTYRELISSLSSQTHETVLVNLVKGVMDNKKIGVQINNMIWNLLDLSHKDISLLTSDWPVHFYLNEKRPHLFMPVSPTLLFVAASDSTIFYGMKAQRVESIIKLVNKKAVERARRYVFSSDEKQRLFIEKHMSKDMIKQPFFTSAPTTNIRTTIHER